MKRISENKFTMMDCSYRLAGISLYCDLMAANGVIVGIRGSAWVAVEKSRADRNDRLTVVLDDRLRHNWPIFLATLAHGTRTLE